MKKQKTSLEKSHSVWSNSKLTALCIVTAIFFAAFWATLAFQDELVAINAFIFIVAIIVTAAVTFFCLLGFKNFKR